MEKTNFHKLVRYTPIDKIDQEFKEKLGKIVEVAKSVELL